MYYFRETEVRTSVDLEISEAVDLTYSPLTVPVDIMDDDYDLPSAAFIYQNNTLNNENMKYVETFTLHNIDCSTKINNTVTVQKECPKTFS